MTSAPYSSTGNTVSFPLELIHTDVVGPMDVETIDGERYALTIIDEFTGYSSVVLLKQKSEAAKEVIAVVTQWETQLGCNVKQIRTDNGTEFNGLDSFCKKRGIAHQRTDPYCHQENGKVERLNRTLQEKARCILAEAQLPQELWGRHSCMLIMLGICLP